MIRVLHAVALPINLNLICVLSQELAQNIVFLDFYRYFGPFPSLLG